MEPSSLRSTASRTYQNEARIGSSATSSKSTGSKGTTIVPAVAAGPNTGKGGGALRSIDQVFQVNPSNGTLSIALPINVSSARAGCQPSLALSYDSGSGNGPFGIGWQLSAAQISRKTSKGIPVYNDSDTFVGPGGEDLIPLAGSNGAAQVEIRGDFTVQRYRLRLETVPQRIERWTHVDNSQDLHWRIISPDNETTVFGSSDACRIFYYDSAGRKCIFSWLITESYDSAGNAISYSYKAENSAAIDAIDSTLRDCEKSRDENVRSRTKYLKSIKYGNRTPNRDLSSWTVDKLPNDWMFEVLFDYGEHNLTTPTVDEEYLWPVRADPFSYRNAGFELRSYRLCRRVLMFHHFEKELGLRDYLVSSTRLEFEETAKASVLMAMTACGHSYQSQKGYSTQTQPSYKFKYTAAPALDKIPLKTMSTSSLYDLPSNSNTQVAWVDLDGEGAPGLLSFMVDGVWSYQRNQTTFSDDPEKPEILSEPEVVTLKPLQNTDFYFDDLEQNGTFNLVSMDHGSGIAGYYERCKDGWAEFQPFTSLPNIDVSRPEVQRADLTGDGLKDLMMDDQDSGELVWYPSLGKTGFDTDRRVLRVKNSPGLLGKGERQLVAVADMSGDGLGDIVKISQNCISYWPNLGHGRFGEQVVMGNAPLLTEQDGFPLDRLRLADVDGSGTTDLLYFPLHGGVRVFHNLCGNSWTDAIEISRFPVLDKLTSVYTIDLLGNGTSCLCWVGPDTGTPSRSVLHYLDLSGGCKPLLMHYLENGIGSAVSVDYRPSTWFYARDNRQQKRWRSKLPFPVHCVNKVTVQDFISKSSFTTRYAYHEGFFDINEQEFRGFGIVERWDAEEYRQHDPNVLYKPPIRTKTWYYTGAEQFCPQNLYTCSTPQLSGTSLPNVDPSEYSDLYRSRKGLQYRQEIFVDDCSQKADLPYTVTETTFHIKKTQPRNSVVPATFAVLPKESLSCVYDRTASDPRISHNLALELNEFNQVVKSANILYGRTKSILSDPKDRKKQEETYFTYVEQDYTNPINEADSYQLPRPGESRQYQIKGQRASSLYSYEDLAEKQCLDLKTAPTVSTDNSDYTTRFAKVLQGSKRTYYRSGNLKTRLPLGKVEPYSVVDQSYDLALTKDLFHGLYGTGSEICGQGINGFMTSSGYEELVDGSWWIASPKHLFAADPVNDLKMARSSFYTACITFDAFGNKTVVEFDRNYILATSTSDELGNTTVFTNDYAHLVRQKITDPNGNRRMLALDAFGRVLSTAVAGKDGERVGDSLNGLDKFLSPDQVQSIFEKPLQSKLLALLGESSNRVIPYWTAYEDSKSSETFRPACEMELNRLTHYTDPISDERVMVKVTYFDGKGKPFQVRELVDPEKNIWCLESWTLDDNKGNPVKSFLPSFCSSHEFALQPAGVTKATITLYDAVHRPVATFNPNHTWKKRHREPWMEAEYDEGDNVHITDFATDDHIGELIRGLDKSEYLPTWYQACQKTPRDHELLSAAEKSLAYASMPSVYHFDACGRIIAEVLDDGQNKRWARSEYDAHGNRIAVYDALGRMVERSCYDLVGRLLYRANMDSGEVWTILDSHGSPMLEWNSRRVHKRWVYDKLRREKEVWISADGKPETLLFRHDYGEDEKGARDKNLRSKLIRTCDQSGERRFLSFDFKGNCTQSTVQLAVEYKQPLDWKSKVGLQSTVYTQTTTYNALNFEVTSKNPQGRTSHWTYNINGRLDSLSSRASEGDAWTTHTSKIKYSPVGQPLSISRGNGCLSTFRYDDGTLLLMNKKTIHPKHGSLEDIDYTYDCRGQIMSTVNKAQQSIFFRNNQVKPKCTYTYDSLGQLIMGTGRQRVEARNRGGWSFLPHTGSSSPSISSFPAVADSLVEYLETYTYDFAGNMLSMKHKALNDSKVSGWSRKFFYEEQSLLEKNQKGNRLSRTTIGKTSEVYGYDNDAGKIGCVTSMPGFSVLSWDSQGRMSASSTQRSDAGTSETTFYVYDSTGARIRKVTERAATDDSVPTMLKETIYLAGLEYYTTFEGDGGTPKTRKAISKIGSALAMVLLESNLLSKISSPLERYQISTNIEVDDVGQLISHEEYSPFGTPVYSACGKDIDAPRAYRFAKYERDKETGLHHAGERYYAAWIGRWISCDPIGIVDSANSYEYCGNDPINFEDPGGTMRKNQADSDTILFWKGQSNQKADLLIDKYRYKASLAEKREARQPVRVFEDMRNFSYSQNAPINTSQQQRGDLNVSVLIPKKPSGRPDGDGGERHRIARRKNTSSVDRVEEGHKRERAATTDSKKKEKSEFKQILKKLTVLDSQMQQIKAENAQILENTRLTNEKLDELTAGLTRDITDILDANNKELEKKLSKVADKEDLEKFFKENIAPKLFPTEKDGKKKESKWKAFGKAAVKFAGGIFRDVAVGLGTTILGNRIGVR